MLFSKYTNSQLGAVVGVGRRRVGVAVGGRRVAVGGTGVNVGVSVARVVGVTVGVSVTVGVGVSVGVGVWIGVAVNGGVGVLVAVGVAVGAGEKSDAKGQLQAMVSIIATTVIHRAVALFAFKSAVLLSRLSADHLRGNPFGRDRQSLRSFDYLAHAKVMLTNSPPRSQLANGMSTAFDIGTGFCSL